MSFSTQFNNDSGSIGSAINCCLPSSPSPMDNGEHSTTQQTSVPPCRPLRTVSPDNMDDFVTPRKQQQQHRWVVEESSDYYDDYDERQLNGNACSLVDVVPSAPPRPGCGLSFRMKPFLADMNHFYDEAPYNATFDCEEKDELENMLFSTPCHQRRQPIFAEDSPGYAVSSSSQSFDDEDDDNEICNLNSSMFTPQDQKMRLTPDLAAPPPMIKYSPSFRCAMDFHPDAPSQCQLPDLDDF